MEKKVLKVTQVVIQFLTKEDILTNQREKMCEKSAKGERDWHKHTLLWLGDTPI